MKPVDYISSIINEPNIDRAWRYMYKAIENHADEHGEISKCGIVFSSATSLGRYNLSKNDIYRIIEKLDNDGFEAKYEEWIDGLGSPQYNISVKW